MSKVNDDLAYLGNMFPQRGYHAIGTTESLIRAHTLDQLGAVTKQTSEALNQLGKQMRGKESSECKRGNCSACNIVLTASTAANGGVNVEECACLCHTLDLNGAMHSLARMLKELKR